MDTREDKYTQNPLCVSRQFPGGKPAVCIASQSLMYPPKPLNSVIIVRAQNALNLRVYIDSAILLTFMKTQTPVIF